MFSSTVKVKVSIRIRFSVWLVSGYAHVYCSLLSLYYSTKTSLVWAILEMVLTANHLTDTDKTRQCRKIQNSINLNNEHNTKYCDSVASYDTLSANEVKAYSTNPQHCEFTAVV